MLEGTSTVEARELIAEYPQNFIVARSARGNAPIGIVFFKHVADPLDHVQLNGSKEFPNGRYIYLLFTWIKPGLRAPGMSVRGSVLAQLLQAASKRCPGASRVVYDRRGMLRIFDLERVL